MEKLDELKAKRRSLMCQLDDICKEIDKLTIVDNESYVGKAYGLHSGFDDIGTIHYNLILKYDPERSTTTPWYEYLYVNTSEEFACISKGLDSIDSILEGSYDEVSIDEFKKALNKAKRNLNKIKI